MGVQTTKLANGITVATQNFDHVESVSVGVWIKAGTRNELEHEHGIAHMLEHMAFKGTKRRKAYHILNRLDSVGGELNAYTTKEKICFYASVLDTYYINAVELLTDITFDSIFPE